MVIHTERNIAFASQGAAFFDTYFGLPDTETLERVKLQGLEQYLPKEVDFDKKLVKKEDFVDMVMNTLICSYPTPKTCRSYMKREEKGDIFFDNSFKVINYKLIKQILTLSPEGKVNALIFRVSTARESLRMGINIMRKIYDKSTKKFEDLRGLSYINLRNQQIFRYLSQWEEQLPILEEVIKMSDSKEISHLELALFSGVGEKERFDFV